MEKPAYPSPRKLSSLTFCYLVSDLFDGSHCGTGQLVTFPSVIDKCAICYTFFDLLLWQVDNFWNKQLQTPVRMAQAHFGWVPWNANQSYYKANRREGKYHYEPMETQSEARENACNRVAGGLTLHLIGWVVSTSFLGGPITEPFKTRSRECFPLQYQLPYPLYDYALHSHQLLTY